MSVVVILYFFRRGIQYFEKFEEDLARRSELEKGRYYLVCKPGIQGVTKKVDSYPRLVAALSKS